MENSAMYLLGELIALAIPIVLGIVIHKTFPKLGIFGAVAVTIFAITALSVIILVIIGSNVKNKAYQAPHFQIIESKLSPDR